MPEVTVCIPTYNHAPFLEQAVVSAATQTFTPVRVIISDDTSTDATPEITARMVARFPNVRCHRHAQNLGQTANANWVMRQAETEFVVRLDSDDYLAPNYLEKLIPKMLAYPEAGYGHGAVTEIDGEGKFRKTRQLWRDQVYVDPVTALRQSVTGYRVAANILVFRRKALQAVDYLDLNISDVEDFDLSIRLADAGFGNVYSPEFLAFYRVFGGTQWSYRRVVAAAEGHTRIYVGMLPTMFRRRGWDQKEIARSRRRRARYALRLFGYAEAQSPEAKQRLKSLVYGLDRSWLTRLAVAACWRGWAPFLSRLDGYKGELKGRVKAVLLWMRRRRART